MMKLLNRPACGCLTALFVTGMAVATPLTASAQYVCQAGYPSYQAAETDLAYLVNVTQYCTHDFGITGYDDGNGNYLYQWCCVANISLVPPSGATLKSKEERGEPSQQ